MFRRVLARTQSTLAQYHPRPSSIPSTCSAFTRCFSSSSSTEKLKRTALYEDHVALGGKMVPFAGYELPVQYKDSVINSHLHCRNSASLFDVSHMGQLRIWGSKRVEFLESLTVADIQSLATNQAKLSVLTNEKGGIIDDCMITSKPDHIYMVINAGCKEKDMAHMREKLKLFNTQHNSDVTIEEFSLSWELIALQGPKAVAALSKLLSPSVDLSKLPFMYSANLEIAGINCIVSRCGYTGEDGFEIAVPVQQTKKLFHALLADSAVLPAGLGVRDSLRLEAGLCLYGHDLNEDISPVEASLTWLLSKRRKEQGGFIGAEPIQKQLKEGVARKRVGLSILQGGPAREGVEIYDESGNKKIGVVTSGTFSPVLQKPVSMGYVATEASKIGTKVKVNVRGKMNEAEVVKMPFVPAKYYKPA